MKIKIVFFLILLLSFLLRLYKLGEIPLSLNWDELSNAYNGYSILNTGRDEYGSFLPLFNKSFDDYKPPLYMYSNVISVGVFGLTPFAARIPSAFSGFLSVPLVYLLAMLIFEKSDKRQFIALLSMFLFSILPWHIQFSRAGYEANIALFTTITSVTFFLYGLKKHIILIPAAIIFGAALYSYHAQRFFLPLFFMITIFIFRRQIALVPRKYFITFTLLALLAVLSLFIFLPKEAIFSRLKSSSLTVNESSKNQGVSNFVDNNYINLTSKYIGNYLSHFAPNFLFIEGDKNSRHNIDNYGMLPLFYLPLLLAGLYYLLKNRTKTNYLLLSTWLLLAPLPSAVATPAPHAIRSSLLIIPIVVVSAFGLSKLMYRIQSTRSFYSERKNSGTYFGDEANFERRSENHGLQAVGIYLLVSILIAYSLLNYLHNYFIHYPIRSAKYWQFGYKEAVIESERLKREFEKIRVSYDFEQAHIFWLFYTKHDPSTYQIYGGRGQFDKYYFTQKKSDVELSKNEAELFISFADNFPQDFKIVKTIYYPDGAEAIKMGHYEKK